MKMRITKQEKQTPKIQPPQIPGAFFISDGHGGFRKYLPAGIGRLFEELIIEDRMRSKSLLRATRDILGCKRPAGIVEPKLLLLRIIR